MSTSRHRIRVKYLRNASVRQKNLIASWKKAQGFLRFRIDTYSIFRVFLHPHSTSIFIFLHIFQFIRCHDLITVNYKISRSLFYKNEISSPSLPQRSQFTAFGCRLSGAQQVAGCALLFQSFPKAMVRILINTCGFICVPRSLFSLVFHSLHLGITRIWTRAAKWNFSSIHFLVHRRNKPDTDTHTYTRKHLHVYRRIFLILFPLFPLSLFFLLNFHRHRSFSLSVEKKKRAIQPFYANFVAEHQQRVTTIESVRTNQTMRLRRRHFRNTLSRCYRFTI